MSLIALTILSPILLVVAVWLHLANKGAGAFFYQERPGKDAKIFKVIKFKTMTDERDADGKLLPDAQRLTKVGKLARSLAYEFIRHIIPFNCISLDAILAPINQVLPHKKNLKLELCWKQGIYWDRVKPQMSAMLVSIC